jgi:hypothetical protein
LDFVLVLTFVLTSVAVTSALGTAAPEASFTDPVIVAKVVCANPNPHVDSQMAANHNSRFILMEHLRSDPLML